MKFHAQRVKHAPAEGRFGDCHRTAIACILDLEPEEVPNFAALPGSFGDAKVFHDNVNAWLATRNLTQFSFVYHGDCDLDSVLKAVDSLNPNLAFILGVQSPGGTDHSVIACGGAIMHDPAGYVDPVWKPLSDPNNPGGFWWVTIFAAANHRI